MSNFIKSIKNTSIAGVSTMISRITGYVREIVLAAWMGTSPATDALIVATKLPTLLRKLTSEGPLHGSLIPLIHDLEKQNHKQTITNLINSIIIMFSVAITLLCCLQIYFSKASLRLLAPGFLNTPERLHWFLTYIAFSSFSTVFFFLYGMFSTILNYHKKFFIPAIAPVFWNISLISCMTIAIHYKIDYSAFGIFFFIASGVQMLVTLIAYLQLKIEFKIKPNKETRKVLIKFFRRFFPVMFSTSVMHINGLLVTIIGSFLPQGHMTHLHRTERLLQIPFGLLLAITTTMLPTLSEIIDKQDELKQTIRSYLLMSFSVAMLVFSVFFFMANPIVNLVFNYGSCKQSDLLAIVGLLKIYSFEIPAFFLIRTISTIFFAKKQTKITTIGAAIHTILNITLSIFLISYNAKGMAYASIISSFVHVLWLSANIIRSRYI